MTHTYIEITAFANSEVIKRIDVTGQTERSIDKVDDGLNFNLNHELYYTRIKEYETKQDVK